MATGVKTTKRKRYQDRDDVDDNSKTIDKVK
jgi:hypothetical protein